MPGAALVATIVSEAQRQGSAFIVVSVLLAALVQRRALGAIEQRARFQLIAGLCTLHLVLLFATGLGASLGAGVARDLRLTGSIAGALAGVGATATILFYAILPRARIALPRIVQDIAVALFSVVAVFGSASRAGLNLSGIIATGAVLTGVVGLALQDLLGNVFGGLGLQLDHTIRVGDQIRVQDVSGRVVEIRWRSTSIETGSCDTVIIPNSVLTRSQVTVIGRRAGKPRVSRRRIAFKVDFRHPPTRVIECIERALRTHPIEHVAADPPPDCVLIELGESAAHYAVRYYLLDLDFDTRTDSVVQTRIYYALRRAEIPLSLPAAALFVTEDSPERREREQAAERQRRRDALARIGLFRDLSDPERAELAESLYYAPFARGEVLTRAGAEAHHLYVIASGAVSVRVAHDGLEEEVARLHAGEYFGEMSLLTGAPRSATVVAHSDVECYRLEADAFRNLLARRSDLAEKVASALVERRSGLLATRGKLSDGRALSDVTQRDLLDRIRAFFRV